MCLFAKERKKEGLTLTESLSEEAEGKRQKKKKRLIKAFNV